MHSPPVVQLPALIDTNRSKATLIKCVPLFVSCQHLLKDAVRIGLRSIKSDRLNTYCECHTCYLAGKDLVCT